MTPFRDTPQTNHPQAPSSFIKDAVLFVLKFHVVMLVVFSPLIFIQWAAMRFMPKAGTTPNVSALAIFLPLVFVLFFVYMWCAVSFVLAEMSGWRKLARNYEAPSTFTEGKVFTWQSGTLGVVGYRRVWNIRVAPSGLYLSCNFLFSLSHKALLIPWSGN